MNKLTIILLMFSGILTILSGCREELVKPEEVIAYRSGNDSLFVIDNPDLKMQLFLPRDLLISNRGSVGFNDLTGKLEIRIGESFMLDMFEGTIDLKKLRQDLREEPLFEYTFIPHGDKSLTYVAYLPGSRMHFYHHIEELEINGRPYVVKTSPEGTFSKQHIQWMQNCISSIRGVH